MFDAVVQKQMSIERETHTKYTDEGNDDKTDKTGGINMNKCKLKNKTLGGMTRCIFYFHFVLSDASIILKKEPHRIGRVYKKAMYRQYTDRTYSQQILGPAWLGFLGPILRAEVDDVIIVHLKNFASRNYSIHPHGAFYKKEAEGKQLQTLEIV